MEDDEERVRVRRGSEHVRIKGTTEELGEIIPPQVRTEPSDPADDEPEGAEHVTIDDGEEIGRR
ncbi:MAG: hypothetical protein JWN44_2161 [Myxococcales bacterium]|nr:hypothetical protein [Myxococcales bacterium]